MGTVIYYYSATGNSFDVARHLSARLGDVGLKSLVPLASRSVAAEDEVLGIVFPVYDWSIPFVVRDFLAHLDVSKAKYVFAIATCNFLPGRSLARVDELLRGKGSRLDAGFVVRMPGTYLPLFEANPPGMVKGKFAAMHRKAARIARIVSSRRRHRLERSALLFDWFLAPKFEKAMEHFTEMDREFAVDPVCNSCGVCAKVCPFGNIEMVGKKPQWLHDCRQCMACLNLCPHDCIQFGQKTQGKRRYKNPAVSLKELMSLASESRGSSAPSQSKAL